MQKKAIFFGSIGTLVETSELQRQAFNKAFDEAGLNWSWEPVEYKQMLGKSGGRQRIEEYGQARGDKVDAETVHKRKTEIFDAAMVEQGLSLRSSVSDVIQHAKKDGLKLAFVTTTSCDNINAIFEAVGDQLQVGDFDFIGDASLVSSGKPSPDIYLAALDRLGLGADACVAIEDTGISAQASLAAGIDTVGFPGAFADRDDFDGAVRITDALTYADLVGPH